MGDPTGPGQHRGDGDDTGDHAPRHLPSTPPPGRYDLGYGSHAPEGRNGTAVRTPPPTAPGWPGPARTAAEADTGQMPIVPAPAPPGAPGAPGAPGGHGPRPAPHGFAPG